MSTKQTNTLSRSLSVIGKLFTGSRRGPSGQRVRQLRKMQRLMGVRFTDLSLLEQALTHRSYSHVTSQTRNESNERMEFLGDSVLGLAVAQFLYLRFPDRTEGALSKMKSLLVSRKVLSAVARDAGFGEFLLLSGEESEMGGRDRTSILADSFEGVIGAIYLDQGYRAANKFIQRFLLGSIANILKDEEHTNYKSLLQEYVQSKRLSHPIYRVRKEVGPEHEKEFAIEVVVRGEVWGKGRGRSKKDAEQDAARDALESRRDQEARGGRGRRSRGARPLEGAARHAPASPPKPVPQHRGEHGILASRERLQAQRRVETAEREQRERERRLRRGERRTAPEGGPAARSPRGGESRPTPGGTSEGPARIGAGGRRRGPRRGRRGSPRESAPARPAPEEPAETVASVNGPETAPPPPPATASEAPPPEAPSEPAPPPAREEHHEAPAPAEPPSSSSPGSFVPRRRRTTRR